MFFCLFKRLLNIILEKNKKKYVQQYNVSVVKINMFLNYPQWLKNNIKNVKILLQKKFFLA